MPRVTFLHRSAPTLALALLVLSLSGCGQTGRLFLREPHVDFPPQTGLPLLPAPLILLPAETTGMVPVGATRLAPMAATAAPAATRP